MENGSYFPNHDALKNSRKALIVHVTCLRNKIHIAMENLEILKRFYVWLNKLILASENWKGLFLTLLNYHLPQKK